MLHLLKISGKVVKTREDVYTEFKTKVNMSPLELENWLNTKTAQLPAAEHPESELIIDPKYSKKLIKILLKRKFMLTKGDYDCLEKITNHINQLYKNKPAEDLLLSGWRYALMNLGHDPFKVLDN